MLEGSLPNHTLATPFSVVGKALHITSFGLSVRASKSWTTQCDPRDLLSRQRAPIGEDETLVGMDGSTLLWWMVSSSSGSLRPSSPRLNLLLHSWVRPSPTSCCEACFPSLTSFLLAFLSFCSPSYPILPHCGFLQSSEALLYYGSPGSAVIPHSGIQRLSSILHSGESLLLRWLSGLRFVVQLVQHSSHATRFSLSLREDDFEWSTFPTDGAKLMMQKLIELRTLSH